MNFILHNNKLISESTFTGINRGLYYGDGFFETIRLINNKVHLLDVHLKRMQIAFDQLGLLPNSAFEKKTLNRSLLELATENEITNGKIRLTVFRKWGGAYIPKYDEVDWIAETTPLNNDSFRLNRKGLLIDIYHDDKIDSAKAKKYKSLNASFYIKAGRFARDKQVDDVFVLNERDEIIETLYSNIFYQLDDKVYTPPVDGGGLPGVMRAYVIHLFQKNGVEVLERVLTIKDLHEIEEIFLTNAIRGIQWVGGYKNKRFYSRNIREYSNWLNKTVHNSTGLK